VDATDAGWNPSGNEIIELGNVDAVGTVISGAPAGDPNINGINGIPVGEGGAPLSNPYDSKCRGAFYSFFPGTGGNKNNQHPQSAVCIFLLTFGRWKITSSARLINSTPNVSVNQLKWKMDGASALGARDYIDFTTSEDIVASGVDAWQFFYLDYGLLVEYDDAPGTNTWLITYTLISD
jgi:hypothetical protein